MMVSSMDGESTTTTTILIGTSQSRILVLRIRRQDDQFSIALVGEPQSFHVGHDSNAVATTPTVTSLTKTNNLMTTSTWPPTFGDGTSSTFGSSTNSNQNQALPSSYLPEPWCVSQILETHQGNWWTVVANRKGGAIPQQHQQQHYLGLLSTWHAPSMTLLASTETREAIHRVATTLQEGDAGFYSVANHQAITVWKSPFQLERTGRIWSTPLSSYAVASSSSATVISLSSGAQERSPIAIDNDAVSGSHSMEVVAVAGVGNKIDLLVNQCQIQVLTLGGNCR